MKVAFTKSAPNVTIEHSISRFHSEIDKSLDVTKSIQFAISEFALKKLNDGLISDEGNSLFAVGVAHYLCLTSKHYNFPLIDKDDSTVNLSNEIAQIVIDQLESVESPDEEISFLCKYLKIRINNSILQTEFSYEVPNTAILTGIIGIGDISALENEDIYQVFYEQIGIHPNDYLKILLSFWAMAQNDIFIRKNKFLENSEHASKLESDISNVLDDLSITIPFNPNDPKYDFHLKQNGMNRSLALFSRFPLIRVSENHFLITSHKFLEVHLVNKLFAKIRIVSQSINTSPLNKILPLRMEEYIKELLISSRLTFFSEYKYLRSGQSQENKSPDLIVFEKHGSDEVCTLIQVKLKITTEKLLHPTSEEELKLELKKYYDFIERSLNFIKNLQTPEKLNDENRYISERILRCKKIFLLGIAPQVPDLFCSKCSRDILQDEIYQKFKDDEFINSYIKQKNSHGILYWHIFGISDLVTILALKVEKRKLFYNLQTYLTKSKISSEDISSAKELPDNFRTHIINKYFKGHMKTRHYLLKESFDSLFKETSEYFNLKK